MGSWRYLGKNVVIYPGAKILGEDRISIGSNVIVDDFVFIGSHHELTIGNHVHIASHASITGGGECFICDFCGLSSGVRLLTGTDGFLGDSLTGPTIPLEFRHVQRGRVHLGAHVVVGANSVILPGVTLGEGAAVGAGSVVVHDLSPWTIYVGVPARPLKPRPPDAILRAEQALYQTHGRPERLFRHLPVAKVAA